MGRRGILDRKKTSECKELAYLGNKSFNVAIDRAMRDGIVTVKTKPRNAFLKSRIDSINLI